MTRAALQRLSDATLVALSLPGDAWPRSLLSNALIPDAWMGLVERRDGRRRFVPAGEDPRPDEDDIILLVRNRLVTVPLEVSGCKAKCGNTVHATCEVLLKWAARDDDLAALRRSVLFQSGPTPPRSAHGATGASGPPLGGAGSERRTMAGASRAIAVSLAELSLDRLAQTVNEAGARIALQRFVRERDAAQLVSDDVRAEFLATLRESLAKFLFEIGASIEQVAKLHFTSRTLAAQQELQRDAEHHVQRIRARELVEQAAIEATHRRLDELTGVFDKLKSAAAGNDRMQWHDMLPSLSPVERGRLLENLWRISPDQRKTTAIGVVAGAEVIWLDPQSPDRILRRVSPSEGLGGLRSIAFDPARRWLLIGAAAGVWAVRADDGESAGLFVVPVTPEQSFERQRPEAPRTGFNSAAIIGDRLYATHSQLGFWSWPLSVAQAPSTASHPTAKDVHCLLAPENNVPRTIRSVAATVDGRVLFAGDDCVHAYNPADGSLSVLAAADDTIHCLTVLDHQLFVGTADGKLLRLDLRQPDDWWAPFRTNGPIESIQARRWNDLVELVVPAGSQGIAGVFTEQNVVTRILDSTTPIRRAWAADDIVVGLNDRRDRLIVMNSTAAQRTGVEVSLARVLGSSIQDACLIVTDRTG